MTLFSHVGGIKETLKAYGFDAEQTTGLTTTMEEMMHSKFDQVLDSIEALRSETNHCIEAFRSDMNQVIEAFRSETNVQLGSVKESMDGLRREMGTEIQSVKESISNCRSEMGTQLGSMKDSISSLQRMMDVGFKSNERWVPIKTAIYNILFFGAFWVFTNYDPVIMEWLAESSPPLEEVSKTAAVSSEHLVE